MSGTGRAARGGGGASEAPDRDKLGSGSGEPGLRYQRFDRGLSPVAKAPIGIEPIFADGLRPVAAASGRLAVSKAVLLGKVPFSRRGLRHVGLAEQRKGPCLC